MKWIEVVSKDNTKYLINVNRIVSIEALDDKIDILTDVDSIFEINSTNKTEALIKYETIKAFCENYGPTPGGLSIESEC